MPRVKQPKQQTIEATLGTFLFPLPVSPPWMSSLVSQLMSSYMNDSPYSRGKGVLHLILVVLTTACHRPRANQGDGEEEEVGNDCRAG